MALFNKDCKEKPGKHGPGKPDVCARKVTREDSDGLDIHACWKDRLIRNSQIHGRSCLMNWFF